jgi:hypothetical protein
LTTFAGPACLLLVPLAVRIRCIHGGYIEIKKLEREN